jgi:hypothetical protein
MTSESDDSNNDGGCNKSSSSSSNQTDIESNDDVVTNNEEKCHHPQEQLGQTKNKNINDDVDDNDAVILIDAIQTCYQSANTLMLSPIEIHQCLNVKDEGSTATVTTTTTTSMDVILNLFSDKCFIFHSSKQQKQQDSKDDISRYNYFTIRQRQAGNRNVMKVEEKDDLVSKFSSLSFQNDKNKKPPTEKNGSSNKCNDGDDGDDDDESQIMEYIAHFIAQKVKQQRISCHQDTMSSKNQSYAEISNAKTTTTSTNGRGTTFLSGFSKSIYNKASSAVTNVLTSYDLIEPAHFHQEQEVGDGNKGLHSHNDHDDYHAMNREVYNDKENNNDDAHIMVLTDTNRSQHQHNNNIINQSDLIWNFQFVLDCWSIIRHHIHYQISILEDDDLLDQIIQISTNSIEHSSMQGLMLERNGCGNLSFLKFCQNAHISSHALLPSSSSKAASSISEYRETIANTLSRLKTGATVEIMLNTLVETNNATLFSDGNIVVLYDCHPTTTTTAHSETKVHINDVDVATFKLNCTIQSLEKRIESLTHQAETMKKRALLAKNQLSSSSNSNNKSALMYMKRRQLYMNEIDRCSTSILNLESGLHSLKRARSDVQVIKAYEMMNETMKAMREENSLSQVERVMEEFHDGNDELQQIEEFLGATTSTVENYDSDDMEKELLELETKNDDENDDGCDEMDSKTQEDHKVVIDDRVIHLKMEPDKQAVEKEEAMYAPVAI